MTAKIESFECLLDDFINSLIDEGIEIRTGIDNSTLSALETKLMPYCLGDDLKTLYNICGGSNPDHMMLGYSDFMTISDSWQEYQRLKEYFKSIGSRWPDALFPIGKTQSTVLVLLEREQYFESNVFLFYPGDGDLALYREYQSLSALFTVRLRENPGSSREELRKTYAADCYFSEADEQRPTPNYFDLNEGIDSVPKGWFY